ncbi:MAG: hypothetical protein V4633_13375 [Pseudomonadota bacterium]
MGKREMLREVVVKRMDDGAYDVMVLRGRPTFAGSHLQGIGWGEALKIVQGLAPDEFETRTYTIGKSGPVEPAPELGLGSTLEDASHRQAIAKLADDLERIKRARGTA